MAQGMLPQLGLPYAVINMIVECATLLRKQRMLQVLRGVVLHPSST
jgi:hypothetical protein